MEFEVRRRSRRFFEIGRVLKTYRQEPANEDSGEALANVECHAPRTRDGRNPSPPSRRESCPPGDSSPRDRTFTNRRWFIVLPEKPVHGTSVKVLSILSYSGRGTNKHSISDSAFHPSKFGTTYTGSDPQRPPLPLPRGKGDMRRTGAFRKKDQKTDHASQWPEVKRLQSHTGCNTPCMPPKLETADRRPPGWMNGISEHHPPWLPRDSDIYSDAVLLGACIGYCLTISALYRRREKDKYKSLFLSVGVMSGLGAGAHLGLSWRETVLGLLWWLVLLSLLLSAGVHWALARLRSIRRDVAEEDCEAGVDSNIEEKADLLV